MAQVTAPPTLFARYVGEGKGSIADLKLQPDGLYFTDLYLDDGDGGPSRARRQGLAHPPRRRADFTASTVAGAAPLTVALRRRLGPAGDEQPRLGLRRRRRQRRGQPVAHLHAAGPLRRHAHPRRPRRPAGRAPRAHHRRRRRRRRCPTPAGPTGPGAAGAADRRLPGDGRGARRRLQAVLGGQRRPDDLRLPDHREFRERNPADGQIYTVQYFERARFEYHPEHAGHALRDPARPARAAIRRSAAGRAGLPAARRRRDGEHGRATARLRRDRPQPERPLPRALGADRRRRHLRPADLRALPRRRRRPTASRTSSSTSSAPGWSITRRPPARSTRSAWPAWARRSSSAARRRACRPANRTEG